MNILITGNSSGLGYGLTEVYLEQGEQVYGISRRGCAIDHPCLVNCRIDLAQLDQIENSLNECFRDMDHFDVIFLNAGILGKIQLMQEASLKELKQVMDVNVWSNKIILDWLATRSRRPGQIVLVSSGAAVSGGKGWSGYSMSKAALNMLTKLYAHEFPDSHLSALAPGIIDTAMQAYISDRDHFDIDAYPGFQRLRDARGTAAMPDPTSAARRIIGSLDKIREVPTGSFVDIRELSPQSG